MSVFRILTHSIYGVLLFVSFEVLYAKEVPKEMQAAVLTNITPKLLENYHYRRVPFDNTIAALAFDEYFRILDPNKSYFTAEDIQKFIPYKTELDDLANSGNSEFAFNVYELFVERLTMYKAFAEETLKTPFNFTIDETIKLDRSQEPYFEDITQMKEFWRKKLKSEILNNRLYRRITEYELANPNLREGLSEEQREEQRKQHELTKLWDRSPEEQVLRRMRDVSNALNQNDSINIVGLYLSAIARSYGPHTDYMAPADDENFDINMKLSLFGIGATLTADDGYVKVVTLVPGSPAAKEGTLQPGDRIIAVTQENEEPVDVIDMSLDKVVKMVRGEEGTKVSLTILPGRDGRGALPKTVSIVRGKVELKDAEAHGKVYEVNSTSGEPIKLGVIKLDSFYMDFEAYLAGKSDYKSCTRDVRKILEEFNEAGVDALVMDMRTNGGGSLPEAISLSGLFIKEGPIVQVRQASGAPTIENDPDSDVVFTGPMTVLVSRYTSSAAEIFAGAMLDYKRAVLMGDSRTYGKGTVLQVTKLERILESAKIAFPAGSLRYECAVFYRVNGNSTQAKGIDSDIIFPSFTENLEVGEEFSPNHLPWDSIKATDYKMFDPDFDAKKSILLKKSADRLAVDQNYAKLCTKVARGAEILKRGEISLNEEKRFNEYINNLELQYTINEEVTSFDKNDLLINEAMNVLTDWLELSKN